MRVLHVISDSNWGGAGTYLITLLSHLEPSQIEPLVGCPRGSQLVAPLRELGIDTFLYGRGERSFHLADVRYMDGLLKRLSPDLVHTHASLSARIAARWHNLPTIYTKHGLGGDPRSPVTGWGHRLLPAGVIAVSEAVAEALRGAGVRAADVTVIHNGVDADQVRKRSKEPSQGASQIDQSVGPRFAYVGRLSAEKGPDLLVQAARHVVQSYPKARFFLFGEGPMREELTRMIVEAGLQTHVTLFGFVSNLPALLARCHLLTVPSRSEGLPLAVLEAMALALPVVATNVGGLGELVVHEVTGRLVPPEDPLALAAAMVSSWNDEQWRRQAGRHGRQRVEESFSARAMAQRTLAFYQKRRGGVSR